ncbi:unnamed protein product [Symbiodinium sp. CCMP2592]|nr:unnamed protein product [Symbiodinium sp. CCMP2592]
MAPKRAAEHADDEGDAWKMPRTSGCGGELKGEGSGKGKPKGTSKSAGATEQPKGSGKQGKGTAAKGSTKSAGATEHPPKGAGKQSAGATDHPPKGAGKQSEGTGATEHPVKGAGKQSKGTGATEHPAKGAGKQSKGTGATEHPAKGAGKQSKGTGATEQPAKGAGKQSKGTGATEHPPKGAGKQSKGKDAAKGSTESPGATEDPTPKGCGKLKGTGKNAGPEEHPHPKGSGKQSQAGEKVELRNLNPQSMKRFFDTETYASAKPSSEAPKGSGKKGSTKSAGPEEHPPKGAGKQSKGKGELRSQGSGSAGPEEHPTPKGSGKQAKGTGAAKGSTKSAGPEEHPNPSKGSGKQSKGKGELKGSTKSAGPADPKGSGKQSKGKDAAKGSTKSAGAHEHPKGSGTAGKKGHKGTAFSGAGKGETRALLKAVHEEAAELCNTEHDYDEDQHWQLSIHDMTNRAEVADSDFQNPCVVLPTCVLGELSNMQAKQPRLCQQRLRNIANNKSMFEMFKNWQAQHHPTHTTAWGKAPAAQLMHHNKFLQDVLQGALEPSTEVDEAHDGEEGEEADLEEDEEEQPDPDDADEDQGWDEEADEGQESGDADQGEEWDDADEGIPTSGMDDEGMDAGAADPPAPASYPKKSILRAPSSISVQSEKSSISPVGVRDQEGKVRVLDEATRQSIQAMTHPSQMDAGERRRQREAMKRYSEKRNEGHYIELPLHELEKRYGDTEEGRRFLQEDILAKQSGREHPQAKGNASWRLYKVYEYGKEISANVNKMGTKVKARKRIGKADETTKKKLGEILTSQAADFVKGQDVLTDEEVRKRDFDKTMSQILSLAAKARTVAQNLTRSGLERQEANIKHMQDVHQETMRIHAEINECVFAGYEDEYVYEKVEEKRVEIEAANKAVLSAEDIVAGHYRLNSEKKKAEKAAAKDGGATDAEYDSSWDTEAWDSSAAQAPAKRARRT